MTAKMALVAVVPVAYAAATVPDLALDFEPTQLVFRADSGSYTFSFDGVEDHGLVRATDTYPLIIWTRQKKVWVKQSGGAAAARLAAYTTA
jgi:hypothetical protein